MIGIAEIILIIVPMTFLGILSGIIAIQSLYLRQKTGEDSIIHLFLVYAFSGFLFIILAISWSHTSDIDFQYWLILLGILSFLLVVLEMGLFYLAVLINPNRVLPSIRLYIPVILGAAVTVGSLQVINNFGKSWQDYTFNGLELLIIASAVLLFFVLQIIIIRGLNSGRKMFEKGKSVNQKFLENVFQMNLVGTVTMLIASFTVFIWFLTKLTESSLINFTLLINDYVLYDWLVFLNIPILLVTYSFVIMKMRLLNSIALDIDINQVYNSLG